jgi:DNA polymerase-1
VSLAAVVQRSKKDPVGRLLAAVDQLGVRFRFSGAAFQVAGAGVLAADDQAVLRQHLDDIQARLAPPEPEVELLEELDVDVEVITRADRARQVLAGLSSGPIGFDIETAPRAGSNGHGWITITKTGQRAKHQPKHQDDSGLDPLRARPRLAQLYDRAAGTVYIIDLATVPVDVLQLIEDRPLVAHNAGFEAAMLRAQGVRLRQLRCTKLMAALVDGAERGGLALDDLAKRHLDLDLPKVEQTSDWAAERLSRSQLEYAAADAVVARRLAEQLWPELDEGSRTAWRTSNATVPVVAAMRIAGLPFDRTVHEQTIAGWEAAYVAARDQFVAITGTEPPAQGPARSAWLEERLPPDMLSWWPRTDSGLLRTRSADLDRLATVPEVRPLLEVITADKRLRCFGRALLSKVYPDGRLHMDLKAAATKSGRCSCSDPNLQQLPQDVRAAVIAPPGRTLVIADYSQIELRVAAELSGDATMQQIFRDGADMHRLNAARFTGIAREEVVEADRAKAKRTGFGVLYGIGSRGLVATLWAAHRIEIDTAEAQGLIDAFYAAYPRLRQWQQETYEVAGSTGVIRSVLGRPLRADWEPRGLRWQLTCNFPVQGSAADVMNTAMVRVHDAIYGRDAWMVLQVHDELVVECAETDADEISALVEREMTAAWCEVFPAAPADGIVEVSARRCWAKPKKG